MDTTLHATVYKHVHLVRIITTTNTASEINDASFKTGMCHSINYFSNLFGDAKHTECKLSILHLQVQQQIDEVNTLLKSCEHVKALEPLKHLTSAVLVMKAIRNTYT